MTWLRFALGSMLKSKGKAPSSVATDAIPNMCITMFTILSKAEAVVYYKYYVPIMATMMAALNTGSQI